MNDEAMPRREQLLHLLADGDNHSGERLAEQLQVTRAAVWKLVQTLRDLGVVIEAQHQGYRLPHALDLLDAQQLQQLISAPKLHIDVLFTVDSTNRYLNQFDMVAHAPRLCVAEIQQAGRGRRGRQWQAPFGSGICMSLGYLFAEMPPGFSALSLVVGVALVRVLRGMGVTEAGLKWPNDVLWRGKKLAGVLIEMRGEPDGPAQVVIGMGMNVQLPEATRRSLAEQHTSVCDVQEALGQTVGQRVSRNELVAQITRELLACLPEFAQHGFAPFIAEWQGYDALRHAEVVVHGADRDVLGVAQGVAEDGSLLILNSDGVQRFVSGEVSLRARSR